MLARRKHIYDEKASFFSLGLCVLCAVKSVSSVCAGSGAGSGELHSSTHTGVCERIRKLGKIDSTTHSGVCKVTREIAETTQSLQPDRTSGTVPRPYVVFASSRDYHSKVKALNAYWTTIATIVNF